MLDKVWHARKSVDRRPPFGGILRAFRDRYVAPFGGTSYDLAPGSLGVHPEHLADAPELVGRQVLVTSETRAHPTRRPAFEIVPLTRLMRDACSLSSQGLVFSIFDLDDPETSRVLEGLHVGEPLYLNTALSRLPDTTVRRPHFGAAN